MKGKQQTLDNIQEKEEQNLRDSPRTAKPHRERSESFVTLLFRVTAGNASLFSVERGGALHHTASTFVFKRLQTHHQRAAWRADLHRVANFIILNRAQ